MDTPAWYFDELAHAGPEHRDPADVAGYDRKAATDPAEDVALMRGLGLGDASVVVDLGAGTGTFALAALRAKVERPGLRNVTCERAGFLSYEQHGAPADLVYSHHARRHLPDFWKALAH